MPRQKRQHLASPAVYPTGLVRLRLIINPPPSFTRNYALKYPLHVAGMRGLLQRRLWRSAFQPSSLRRAQHDYPPHKEYFQNPSQTPHHNATAFPPPSPPRPSFPTERSESYLIRALRSVGWAVLFQYLGFMAGTAVITWEYLQPAFPRDSEEEAELQEEVLEMLNIHPLVQNLRQKDSGWVEEQFYVPFATPDPPLGQSALVSDTLATSSGVTFLEFSLPGSGCTIIVFFLGNGLEGWPDTIHGGLISTILIEAMTRHAGKFHCDENSQLLLADVNVRFEQPMRSGEIYSVLVPPCAVNPLAVSPEGETVAQLSFTSPVVQMVDFHFETEFDEATKTENQILAIENEKKKGKWCFAQVICNMLIGERLESKEKYEMAEIHFKTK